MCNNYSLEAKLNATSETHNQNLGQNSIKTKVGVKYTDNTHRHKQAQTA